MAISCIEERKRSPDSATGFFWGAKKASEGREEWDQMKFGGSQRRCKKVPEFYFLNNLVASE